MRGENEESWVLVVKGNLCQGPFGACSRKRLLGTLVHRFHLAASHHKALLERVILPRCNRDIAAALRQRQAQTPHAGLSDDGGGGLEREDENGPSQGTSFLGVEVAIDWETIEEGFDELALRHLAAWGGYFSLAQVALAFKHLASSAPCAPPPNDSVKDWGAVVKRVVVRHIPGLNITRKRCFVEGETLYIDGVWEADGWRAGFRYHQIVDARLLSASTFFSLPPPPPLLLLNQPKGTLIRANSMQQVLTQTRKLGRCSRDDEMKLKHLKQIIDSTKSLGDNTDHLKWVLSQPCFHQPVLHTSHRSLADSWRPDCTIDYRTKRSRTPSTSACSLLSPKGKSIFRDGTASK